MKIAIISDSHDNVKNLEDLIKWLNHQKIQTLIHAGDLSAPSILINTIGPNYHGEVHLIFGNIGDKILIKTVTDKIKNIKYYGQRAEIEIKGKKILIIH